MPYTSCLSCRSVFGLDYPPNSPPLTGRFFCQNTPSVRLAHCALIQAQIGALKSHSSQPVVNPMMNHTTPLTISGDICRRFASF